MSFYRKHPRFYTPVGGPSLTQQHMKDECDINRILKKYQKEGILRHVAKFAGRYEDLPDSIDYQESLNAVMAAQEAFISLPSSVRGRFDNDPGRFLAFVGDPANSNELVSMGLASHRPPAKQSGGAAPKEADPAAPDPAS